MSVSDDEPFSWRSLLLPIALPTLLFSFGEGAILPFVPLVAGNLGAGLALAGFVAAMFMVGELLGSLPSGRLVAHIGERPAMLGAACVAVLGLTVCVLSRSPGMLTVGVFVVGLATAVFALARHAFLTTYVPHEYRARALSSLGGVFRAGLFLGPFATAALNELTGDLSSAFWIYIVAAVAAGIALLVIREPKGLARVGVDTQGMPVLREDGLIATFVRSRSVLLKLGTGAALISAMRASRMIIMPLWAVSIGFGETNTAVLIGIVGAIEFALFYTSGQIMDRVGRLWAATPAMAGMSLGHLALFASSFAAEENRAAWFIAAAAFMALANGVGSGIVMTIGADLTDKHNPAPFLGVWRFTSNLGTAGAPLLVSMLAGVASVAVSAGSMGVLGFVGLAILVRYIPRYVPHVSS